MDTMEQDGIPMQEQISRILSRIQDSTNPDDIRADIARLVMFAAEPGKTGDNVTRRLTRAARRLGMNRNRVRKFWYGEVERVTAHEMNLICRVARAHLQRVRRIEALRAEIRDLDTDMGDTAYVGAG
ncbi:MAG: hypothetical protein RIA64_01265 [Rhodospirillales bacterium]